MYKTCTKLSNFKKNQIRINFYTNILALIANVIVGIYYTPYLVRQLGIVAYGVVPLALIINQYISIVTGSLTGAFSRFYSVSIQQKKYDEASENLSTALVVVLLLIILLCPILLGVVYRIDSVFNIPVQLVRPAQLLFIFTIFSFFLSLVTSLLNVTMYALNRLDWINYIKIVRTVLKLLGVIIFFSFFYIDIIYVGLSNLITELLILLVSLILFLKFTKSNVKINLMRFNKLTLYSIGGMAIWVLVHQIGDTGLYRIDNFIVNKYWGLTDSAKIGAISEFVTYILLIVSVLGSLFGPLILMAYSKDNHVEVRQLAFGQSYIVGSLAAIISGIIAGYAASILRVWLGESFGQYGDWLTIKMISVPFYAAGGVLAFVYRTWNKVKFPAIATLILGTINFLIVFFMALNGTTNISFVLIVCGIFAILQCYFLNAYCVNKIYKGSTIPLVISAGKIEIIFIISFFISKIVESYVSLNNVFLLMFVLASSAIFLFVIVYFIFYNSLHRKQLLDILFK